MKKPFLIASCLLCSVIAKAQSFKQLIPSALDTVKTWSLPLGGLKANTGFLNPKALPDRPPVTLKNDELNLTLTADDIKNNMPVATLAVTDRMPIKYLGDTENMHYDILIKGPHTVTKARFLNHDVYTF